MIYLNICETFIVKSYRTGQMTHFRVPWFPTTTMYHGNTAANRYISTSDLGLNRFQNFEVDPISPFQYLAFGCGLILGDSILLLENCEKQVRSF